jgi:Zn-dependent protease
MEESIRFGRIAGIPVGANWSLLLIFWLIAWGLAIELPTDYPGHATGTYWVAAVGAALVFYGGLLAHELGHALMARRLAIPVEGITLWLFGGMTRTRGEATSPGGALRVALVGPLVSAVAAAVFGMLALALDVVDAPALVEGLAGWLAWINFLLAAFNLVPAAPLDGGRVLQAVLWRRNGDRLSASATAARAGRGFGYVMIGLGILDILAGVGVGGLWFVLLGWFLAVASRTEQASAEARVHLEGVRVAEVMTPGPVLVPGWITIDAFIEDYVGRHRPSAFPVQNFDGALAGVVTLRAIKEVPGQNRATLRVRDVAVPVQDVVVARPDDMVLEVTEQMSGRPDHLALVVDDGQVVGLVSPTDIARALDVGALRHGGLSARGQPKSLSKS